MPERLRHLAAVVVLALSVAGPACDGPGDEPPPASPGADGRQGGGDAPSIEDDALALQTIDGLQAPTQVVFLSDDDLLVAEKSSGRIMRVRDGRVLPEPVAQLAANTADERGILGLALHPGFEHNRYVYVFWTWRGGSEPDGLFGQPTGDIDEVPPLGSRIDRFTWDGARLAFERNILRLPSRVTDLTLERRRGNHNGGVIRFGPDGKLYAAIGDQNDRGPLQNLADGEQRSGIDSLTGALLRLNDDGTIPADNPFAGRVDDLALEYVYLFGIPNTYGFDFDPETGGLWLSMNGHAAYDQLGRYTPGDNAGWIQIMGPPARFDDFKALELADPRQLDNPLFPPAMLASTPLEALSRLAQIGDAPYRPPLLSWRHSIAPTALRFIPGDALGDEHQGMLLAGDAGTGVIYQLELTASRDDLVLEDALADRVNDNDADPIAELAGHLFGTGFNVVTDIEVAPDGALWVASLGNNAIYRITRD